LVTKPRRWAGLAALAAIAVFLAGCGGGGDDSSELTGLIVDIQGRGDDISSFTLRSGDQNYDIRIAPEVDYGFQLGHLRTHQSALYPVRATVERREGRLYALEIVDA
jgi:hypothetical protein